MPDFFGKRVELPCYVIIIRVGVVLDFIGAGALAADPGPGSLGMFAAGVVTTLAGIVGYLWNEE